MFANNIKSIIREQRQFFATGHTLPLEFRIEQLKKLRTLIEINESKISDALKKDLNKAPTEAIVSEILLAIDEIKLITKNLKKWMRPKKVATPFFMWPGRSQIYYEPYGTALIIGPWNYPFLLLMSPLIGAISAGNCVVVKPSEIATHTQNVVAELINENFSAEYITVVKGGHEEVSQILQEKFDYIFFTGGTQIGKIVMEAAAKHLTPVTLELGGKSPCIVDETADIDFAARRIAWAKTQNAGQVCISPDYLYVNQACKNQLIEKLKEVLTKFYGSEPEKSSSFGRIINKKHFDRLQKLIQKGNILFGGKSNEQELYISPTLIDGLSWQDPIMQEEIFGPLLPILTYNKLDDVINTIKTQPKPLALYLFTKNKAHEQKVLREISFGNGCINDCLMQIMNLHLPFGGTGLSGIGHYHGKYSFETFSHQKSIYKKLLSADLKLEYPPYNGRKLWWLRRVLKS